MTYPEILATARIRERELLARLFLTTNEKELVVIAKNLVPEDFYHYRELYSRGLNIRLSHGSLLEDKVISKARVSDFVGYDDLRPVEVICSDVKQISLKRRVAEMISRAAINFPDGPVEEFITGFQKDLVGSFPKATSEAAGASQLILKFKDKQRDYHERFLSGERLIGLSTGYQKLDEVIDGLRPEHLWVIGGYTSTGKTFAALNLAASLVRQGKRVVYYSLEMSQLDILSRMIGILTGINGITVLKSFPHDKVKVEQAFELLRLANFTVFDSKHQLSDILFSMYEENLNQKVDLFVVDFIQLVMTKDAKNDYERSTEAVLELQQSAKRFHAPVIILSQVSNESARGGDQVVIGYKGTGAIAAAADLGIELNHGESSIEILRDKMGRGEPVKMKWSIRKNRHGKMGVIKMVFEGHTGKFLIDNEEEELDRAFNNLN